MWNDSELPCYFLLEQKHEIGRQAYQVSAQQLYHQEFPPLLLQILPPKLLAVHKIYSGQQATHLQQLHIQQLQSG